MQDSHRALWDNCLSLIRQNVTEQQFQTWFAPIVFESYSEADHTLLVQVQSSYVYEYLEQHYVGLLSKVLTRCFGTNVRLTYRIVTDKAHRLVQDVEGEQPVEIDVPKPTNRGNQSPTVMDTVPRDLNPQLDIHKTFQTFIEGESNKLPRTVGLSIAEHPGKSTFNPFFIYGPSGCGKTHLINAIGLHCKELYPAKRVLYVSARLFQVQYTDAVRRNTTNDFINFYQTIDVLIVDDIHQLQGQASQNAFFNVFNHLHQSGKQLIFTSDRAPVDLKNFEERLLSRFKWGLSVELLRPDFATRLAMLKAKAFREGVPIHDDILNFIATRVKTNFRELEGTLISLIAQATLLKKEITMELAEKVTSNLVGEEETEISIDKIVDTVCDYFNITRDDILSKSRKRPIVQARQIAMYECRNLIPSCSLATIGSELGGRDHATVLYACTTVQDLMTTDRDTKKYVSDIENMLSVPVEA